VIERKYLLTKTTLFFMQNLFFFLQEIRDNGDTHLIPRAFFLQTRKFLLLNYVSPAEIIDNLQLTEEDFRPLSDCNFYEYADLSYYRVLSCSDFWQRIILPLLES
jgi:hypothetical protein